MLRGVFKIDLPLAPIDRNNLVTASIKSIVRHAYVTLTCYLIAGRRQYRAIYQCNDDDHILIDKFNLKLKIS